MTNRSLRIIIPSVLAVLLSLTAGPASAGLHGPQEENPWMDLGRSCTDLFFSGVIDELYGLFDKTMKDAMSEEQLLQFLDQVGSQMGEENELLEEKTSEADVYHVYQRISTYTNSGAARIEVRWTFNGDGQVAGFFIRPAQVAHSGS